MNRPTSVWREVVHQKLQALPAKVLTARGTEELSPLLLHAGADADVVTLPLFRVTGSRIESGLPELFRQQRQQAKEQMVLRRAGIGIHSVGYGHFGASVLTVFYIPVAAGIGFSW